MKPEDLKEFRQEQGWSQARLAHLSGYSLTMICKMEQGSKAVSKRLSIIAGLYSVVFKLEKELNAYKEKYGEIK